MRKSFIVSLHFLLLFMVMFTTSCKKDDSTKVDIPAAIKETSGYSATFSNNLAKALYVTGKELPASATYNSGWWKLNITLPLGQTAEVEIHYQDKNSNVQKNYNPETTYYIKGKGNASSSQGSTSFNFTLSGTDNKSDYFIVDGNATVEYEGTSATVQINNLKIKKQVNAYPESGSMTIISYGSRVTITFDGTKNAHGEFEYNGTSYSFTIDLETGQIS